MNKLIGIFLLVFSAACYSVTWHACPPTDPFGNAITYGTGDGTSRENCFSGATDAWANASDIDAGDMVIYYPGWYYEKNIVGDSGTEDNPITIYSDGAIWFDSHRIDGNYTTASNNTSTTGSSWSLVSGTSNIYKKGIGGYVYKLYVNNVEIPFMTPHKTTEEEVLASLGENQFTVITKTTDGFSRTIYYRGQPSPIMRVNNLQTSTTADWGFCNICIVGKSYINWYNASVRGFSPLYTTAGGFFIEDSGFISLENAYIAENIVGLRIYKANNVTLNESTVERNVAQGVAIGATKTIMNQSTGEVNQIQSITLGSPTTINTKIAHGLTTGDRVYFETIGGTTQLSSTEHQVTVSDSDTFTIAVDSTAYGAYTGTGKIFIQSKNLNTKITNSLIQLNGAGPRYNGINVTWANDDDGIGVGYRGGEVIGLIIEENRIFNNGPQRNILAGEAGDQNRGRGIYFGTSETFNVYKPIVSNNWFMGNHQSNLEFTDTVDPQVYGNIFAGTKHFDGTTTNLQLEFNAIPASGTTTSLVAGNLFTGESGIGAIYVNNVIGQNSVIINNLFVDLTPMPTNFLRAPIYYNSATNSNFIEGGNWFYNNTVLNNYLYQRGGSTGYTTVSAWNSATGQGTASVRDVDPQIIGTINKILPNVKVKATSPLCGAGINGYKYKDAGNRTINLFNPSIGPVDCDAEYSEVLTRQDILTRE